MCVWGGGGMSLFVCIGVETCMGGVSHVGGWVGGWVSHVCVCESCVCVCGGGGESCVGGGE